jgi:hypothetical protein
MKRRYHFRQHAEGPCAERRVSARPWPSRLLGFYACLASIAVDDGYANKLRHRSCHMAPVTGPGNPCARAGAPLSGTCPSVHLCLVLPPTCGRSIPANVHLC